MYSDRIKSLPPYLFAAIDKAKQDAIARGVDVIDLGVGDPDVPTPAPIIEALCRAARDTSNHRYPSYIGKHAFRQAVSNWYMSTFKVSLDATSEVLALIGSKEGIAHAPLAFVNPGDVALVPDPAYPVYKTAVQFAGGIPITMPLLEENGFLPDLYAIDPGVAKKAKIMFLNYPNNPTGSTAGLQFFKEAVEFARENGIIIMHDNPYSEVFFGQRCPSILEIPGAKEVAVEFHSLSKTYSMAGWRVGAVVGNAAVVSGIGQVKSNIDSGNFGAVQDAGIAAMRSPRSMVEEMRGIYRERMEILSDALKAIGFQLSRPKATFYLWARTKGSSMEFSRRLLEEAGIVATPGIGFGQYGEGYIRFSVTQPTERIVQAAQRLTSGNFNISK